MKETELAGKRLLIGITFLDAAENMVEQYQTHGKIVSVGEGQGIVIEKADGSGSFTIPPDFGNLHVAAPGEYKIRTTGEVVVNPDLTSVWTVHEVEEGDREEFKRSGFGGS